MMLDQHVVASDDQRAAIAFDGGNAYVGAGPGTGKTVVLVERYRTLRARGFDASAIVVLTFSRRAVLDVRAKLATAGFPDAEVRTFHGFAERVIGGGTATFRDGRLLDGASRALLLREAIARTPTPAFGERARLSAALRADLAAAFADFGRAVPATRAAARANASPRLRDALDVYETYARARLAIGGSDLGDLVVRAVVEASRSGSPAACFLAGRYAHVLVDEFQDCDRMQLDLLARCDATIFAVGDEAQAIYRFRGASDDVVTAARARFAMTRFDLTVSRRCPPAVTALASRAEIPGLVSLRSARADGMPVRVLRFGGIDDEAAFLANEIESRCTAGTSPERIAVLLRAYRPLGPLLASELRARGLAVAATGREALLADPRIGTMRAALELFARPHDAQRWSRLLCARPLGFDPLVVRFASATLAKLHLDDDLASALAPLTAGAALDGAALARGLRHAYGAWQADDLGTAARRLVRGLRLSAAALRDEPGAVRGATARLQRVCDALAGLQRTARALAGDHSSHGSCAHLVADFPDVLLEVARDDAGAADDVPGVRVLTVHASKGLEFPFVYVADAVQGRFPQEPRAATFFDERDRETLRASGVDGPSAAPNGATGEEASLWYVAVTRCSESLAISYAERGIGGERQRPSRFLPVEMLAPAAIAVDRESLVVRALCGPLDLRARVAASGLLAASPAERAFARDDARAFAPSDALPLEHTRDFSVGDVETWLQCPRRLFYKRFAHLPSDGSAALTLGSALHETLERFHETRVAFDAATVDVQGWSTELVAERRRAWPAYDFESPVVAEAAARSADVALRGYARELGRRAVATPFVVEAREIDVRVAAGAHEVRGRVDRVDRLATGTRVIVDYKSGGVRVPNVAKVASDVARDWLADDGAERPRSTLARRASSDFKIQLALYATAFDAVSAIAYVFLTGAKEPEFRDGAVVETLPFDGALRDVTHAVLTEVDRDLLEPLEDGRLHAMPVTFEKRNCTYCAYVSVCPGPAEDVS